MAGLNESDMEVLGKYANDHNRTLYWNYLAQHPGNDSYGLLALGVVRNDNMPGAVANAYAQQQVQAVNHRQLSEREWESFGRDLIQQDLSRRQLQMKGHRPDLALNLPVEDVQKAHDAAFKNAGLTLNAWTPRQLLESARRHGSEAAAEDVWRNMLDSGGWGSQRLARTTSDVTQYGYDRPQESAQYLARLGMATGVASQSLTHDDPNKIGTKDSYTQYFPKQDAWYEFTNTPGAMGGPSAPRHITDARELRGLDDARNTRLERQQKATEFDPRDPYRNRPLAKSPFTIADNAQSVAPEVQTASIESAPASPRGSVDDLFNRLADAAIARDADGMRSVGREYLASDAGQQWLQAGRDHNEAEREIALALQRPSQVRQAAADQVDPQQQSGPVMRM